MTFAIGPTLSQFATTIVGQSTLRLAGRSIFPAVSYGVLTHLRNGRLALSGARGKSLASESQQTYGIDLPKIGPDTCLSDAMTKFIENNYTLYDGSGDFLKGPTPRTEELWSKCTDLLAEEMKNGGLLDVDVETPSDINAFGPGYLDKDKEVVYGFQTDAPLKRSMKPYGGWNIVRDALHSYGRDANPRVEEIFTKYARTHNQAVFDVYTPEMRAARKNGLLTGLPDGYGRGRIIGDYRRVALFGVDALIQSKKDYLLTEDMTHDLTEEKIRQREEIAKQIDALKKLKDMALAYGHDISKPATSAVEATQWLYYGYLAAVKESDGAAMSLGRVDAFLDIFIENDLKNGRLTEESAQELIDDFVMKLRLVRHLRTPEYNALFSGDPTWVTAVVGGTTSTWQPLVTKTSFRMLHTLYNMGRAPEPNLTVLWSDYLPEGFRKYCAAVSIDTSSIQYENDAIMRKHFGSDYAVACCVSGMKVGRDMQYFGARANLPKLLLYSMNQGRDEITKAQVGPAFEGLPDGPLDYDKVLANYEKAIDWLAGMYVDTMNCIHFAHDRYNYEAIMMALHDQDVRRFMAFGVAGLSVAADSLAAIKYAKVTPVRDTEGVITSFEVEGDYPQFGNDDERVDEIAQWLVSRFHSALKSHPTHRDSEHTLSVLTITSNVVYGKNTGDTPDGRKRGEPFAPGANPLHGRDHSGALSSLNSVAGLPYDSCLDGISNTFSATPSTLGKDRQSQIDNLAGLLSGYIVNEGHHLNVNTISRETLLEAMDHPEKYPQLTIRVSGYAVNFHRLTREQQLDVVNRTFHQHL